MSVPRYNRTSEEVLAMHAIQQWVQRHFATDHLVAPITFNRLWPRPVHIVNIRLEPSVMAVAVVKQHCDWDFVLLNTYYGALSQRFSLAHELMHLTNHREIMSSLDGTFTCSPHPLSAFMEFDANVGAAELLLPRAWFMDQAAHIVGTQLHCAADVAAFLQTPEARRWAGHARVSRPVLGQHLFDTGWVTRSPRLLTARLS